MIDLLNTVAYGDTTVGDIALSAIIMVLAVGLAKCVTIYLRRGIGERIEKNYRELILKLIYYLIVFIGFLTILPLLGFSPSGLLVAGGITGIVIGFASQSVVSNLISGIFILWEKPIRIGDQVQVGDISGFVEDINVMSTIIRTYDGLFVRIPNQTLFTGNITNYTGNVVRRFEYRIGVRYSDDPEKAVEIIKRVVDEEPFALKNPDPAVFVDELGDNAVIISVRIWAPVGVWYGVKMRLLSKIKTELERNGISIPFPQRVVWFANELELAEGSME